ncbi:MAG: isochorismatase family protein [Sphingomonadaceae bacterium]
MANEKAVDLGDDYVRGGFDGRLPFGKRPVLLIVDVCNAYLDKASPLYAGVEDALDSNVRLTAAARSMDVPVIFTRVVYQSGGVDGGLFYRKVPGLKVFLDGSPFADFPDALQPRSGELIITKQYASAFFGTSLAATLTSLGADCTIITGFSTSGCVRATAVDAVQHGFLPFVVREACGDRNAPPHEANLFDLQAKYAEVVSEAGIISLMTEASRRARG